MTASPGGAQATGHLKDDPDTWSPGALPQTPSVGGNDASTTKPQRLTGDGRVTW
ncbi:hypothetical protein ACIBSV_27255 [Embleya sp. NPDC050154]|uniref:hypothetical protein n=1 Tax=Embleya sp. NPDC050154 TaxID=3363988 RepID=UPI0037A879DE